MKFMMAVSHCSGEATRARRVGVGNFEDLDLLGTNQYFSQLEIDFEVYEIIALMFYLLQVGLYIDTR